MKRFVFKSITGKWANVNWGDPNDVTFHDTWREAFNAAFIMARKVLTNS